MPVRLSLRHAAAIAALVLVGFLFGLLLRPQAPDAGGSRGQPVAAAAVAEVGPAEPAAAPGLGGAAALPTLGRTPRRGERVRRATATPAPLVTPTPTPTPTATAAPEPTAPPTPLPVTEPPPAPPAATPTPPPFDSSG